MRVETQPLRGLVLHALRAWLIVSLISVPIAVFATDPDQEESEPFELERLAVTGTRIKRLDVEGALPVTIITREDIELTGETSLAEVLRNLSFNSFGSYRSTTYSPGMGTAQINLRGLGSKRSLVLIDGRRLPKAPASTAYQDLNVIPIGAVERIEVLSDGASAIYGSDAIGGVVNIITREDYDGWELHYGHAEPSQADGGQRDNASVLFGRSGDRTRVIAVASWNRQEVSHKQDFQWHDDIMKALGNNFSTWDSERGQISSGATAIPGGCAESEAFYLLPNSWSLNGQTCFYDANRIMSEESSLDTGGVLFKIDHDIDNDWSLWADLSWAYTDAWGRWAPLMYIGLVPRESPNNPTNPASALYDPIFGSNVPVYIVHRMESLGNRNMFTETTLDDLQAGVTAWWGGVELDFGVRVANSSADTFLANHLRNEVMDQYMGDGTYDLQHPRDNPPEVLDAVKEGYYFWDDYDQNEAFATVAWDLFEIGGQPVQWVAGGEFRREMYDAETTDPDGSSKSSDRDITALYFESLLPFGPDVELSLAGRYDNYSDWGDNFAPKISGRWRVTDEVVVRASWGEGFRAPQLAINTVETNSGVDLVQDPPSCAVLGLPPNCWVFVPGTFTVSPTLTAEQSEQYSAGLVWEPSDLFNLTLDYYDITLDEEIHIFGTEQILQFEQYGQTPPPGLGVERAPDGLLLHITSGWGNLGLVETSGLDVNAQLHFELGPGRWKSNLQATHVFEYVIDEGIDWVGKPGHPDTRATMYNHYDLDAFTFAWNIHYIASQMDTYDEGTDTGEGRVPSWTTHDVQAVWHAPWEGRVTLGAQNVFDELPPLGLGRTDVYTYDRWLYDGWGRILYFRYTQVF